MTSAILLVVSLRLDWLRLNYIILWQLVARKPLHHDKIRPPDYHLIWPLGISKELSDGLSIQLSLTPRPSRLDLDNLEHLVTFRPPLAIPPRFKPPTLFGSHVSVITTKAT